MQHSYIMENSAPERDDCGAKADTFRNSAPRAYENHNALKSAADDRRQVVFEFFNYK